MPLSCIPLRVLLLLGGLLLAPSSWADHRRPHHGDELAEQDTKGGTAFLRVFGPATEGVRRSIVQFEIDGRSVGFGAVLDANGEVITKASELTSGSLTCRFTDHAESFSAKVVAIDEDNDLALVIVRAPGIKPVAWATNDIAIGQWAITPGLEPIPAAVGVISATPRKILPKRAYLGILPDFGAKSARIRDVMPGFGAEKAGLKAGDVILTLDSKKMNNGKELVDALRNYRDGQSVKLSVLRGEEQLEFSIQMMVPKPERPVRGVDRQERMNRLGSQLSRRAEGFQLAIQHDSVLQPWQCGGPLLNLEGRAIGLNIARAGRIASYALPADLLLTLVDRLKERMEVAAQIEAGQASQPH